MKKILFYSLAILAVLFAYSVQGQNFRQVDRSNSGQTIQVAQDQVLEVRLPTNPSTGYNWFVINTDNKSLFKTDDVNNGIIQQIGKREFVSDSKDQEGMVGAPGTQILRFVGVSKGTSQLKLVRVRPWLKDIKPIDEYTINVVNEGTYTGTYKPPVEPQPIAVEETDPAPKGPLAVPTNFSWLDQFGCTPVTDQGDCGSCWAFAAIGCFEAAVKIVDYNTRDISEQWLINCSSMNGCQGGTCPFSYIKSSAGAVYNSDVPYADYNCDDVNTALTCINQCETYTHHEKITGQSSFTSSTANIQTNIYTYGPIWCSVDAAGTNFNNYTGGVLTTSDGSTTDHAVVLVGWNGTGGYWIMRNSWSNSWGENGYCRIKYGIDAIGSTPSYLQYGTISHTIAPHAAFGASFTSSNCNGGPIQFYDSSFNVPTAWAWDFGDGTTSTLQNPTHIYTASGTYTVSLKATNANGNNTATKTSFITITLPTAPTTTGASTVSGSVTLQASGNGTLYWYNNATGGSPIKTGTSYITPSLTQNDTFYVQSVISHTTTSVGKASSTLATSTGGYYTAAATQGLYFDAYEPFTIKSVTVYSSKATSRTIYLKNSSGTIIDSLATSVNGTASVNLNFHVPEGTGYTLYAGFSNYLWRDTTGATYPYTVSGVLSITGNTADAAHYYYYFYNWQILQDSCVSARVPVVATLLPNGINEYSEGNLEVFPNPSDGSFVITLSNNNYQSATLTILNVLGKKILEKKITDNNAIHIDASSFEEGVYFVELKTDKSTYLRKITITK